MSMYEAIRDEDFAADMEKASRASKERAEKLKRVESATPLEGLAQDVPPEARAGIIERLPQKIKELVAAAPPEKVEIRSYAKPKDKGEAPEIVVEITRSRCHPGDEKDYAKYQRLTADRPVTHGDKRGSSTSMATSEHERVLVPHGAVIAIQEGINETPTALKIYVPEESA